MPTRRAFLGSAAVLAAGGVLVACGSSSDEQIAITGSIPAAPDSSTTTAPGSAEGDVVIASTGQSLELLAVEVYQTALDSGLLTTPAIIQTAELFQSQHAEHGEAIGAALVDLGQPEVTEPNQYVLTEVVQPGIDELTDEMSVVALALAVEDLAASTYVKNTPVLTLPELRSGRHVDRRRRGPSHGRAARRPRHRAGAGCVLPHRSRRTGEGAHHLNRPRFPGGHRHRHRSRTMAHWGRW